MPQTIHIWETRNKKSQSHNNVPCNPELAVYDPSKGGTQFENAVYVVQPGKIASPATGKFKQSLICPYMISPPMNE